MKIAAVPADAVNVSVMWYAPGGAEIGPDIWGEFAIILQVSNDAGAAGASARVEFCRTGSGAVEAGSVAANSVEECR